MPHPVPPVAATSEDFLAQAGPRLAELCTACGKCFEACPMVATIGLVDSDKVAVTQGLRALARGEAGPADTVRWAGSCAKSGLCVSACPERDNGLNAMLLVRIARQNAINRTAQLKPKADPAAFPRVKVFARMQLSEEELKKWL